MDNGQQLSVESFASRRTVIRGVAAAGVAVAATPLLAACGGDDEPDSGATNTTTADETTTPTSEGPTTAGETTAGGEALVATSQVPEGGGVILKDEELVVTQPNAGEFKCFTAICTHQGCVVSSVSDGEIKCACHGSKYSIEDGSVTGGPAPSPLAEEPIVVTGDQISLA